jgi:hypothetical protein
VAGDVRSEAEHLLSRTRDEVQKEVSSRTNQFATTLHEVAGELRTMADADAEGRLHGLATSAADRTERFASQLDSRGFDGVVSDLKRTVRRRPGLVLASAAAVGFVVGRLVRDAGHAKSNESSAPQSGQQHQIGSGPTIDLTGEPATYSPSTDGPALSSPEVRHG